MDIQIWGFVLNGFIFLGGLFKIYTDMQVKFKEMDVRLNQVEKQDEAIFQKLDRIIEAINEVKLDLKDKADRND